MIRTHVATLSAALALGGLVGGPTAPAPAAGQTSYEPITLDTLEPFRSAFNAAVGQTRLVLLVGPT